MQDEFECYFLIANVHAFTNPARAANPLDIRQSVLDIGDGLAVRWGLIPENRRCLFSPEVPAIAGDDVSLGDADSVFAGDEESDDQG